MLKRLNAAGVGRNLRGMDVSSRPPAYAWDWFARQRLLWREVRKRLAVGPQPTAGRYRAADTKSDVVALIRADYPRDDRVREAVARAVSEIAFLGRIDAPFAQLGVRAPPRGMRWWWTALTGEDLDAVEAAEPAPPPATQLSLDEVHEGLGG